MLNLIPWKQRNDSGSVAVRHAEPSRGEFGFHPLSRFRDDFETLVSRFFDDPWAGTDGFGLSGMWDAPRFDWNWDLGWEDNEKEYVLHAELPGFEPEEFDVKVSGNSLTIHAEHKDEKKEKNGDSGYRYGSFTRTVALPNGADHSSIDARYHSGVLEVHLPKTEQAQGKRIPVTSP